ncbi:spore germination protein PF [Bacillus ectoiniformans]|nr:spore germination protein [Bacillus ectoiniformans]MBM7647580.1 spore germination protein PF [Bacillus ectoiniformans]
MPAIIGPVTICNMGGGTVHYGDTLYISPKSASKTAAGAGSLNTGPFIVTYSGLNANPVFNCPGVDQPIVGNN